MSPTRKLVIMNGGWWSTNIGNAFYNLGTQYVLNQIFPDDQVVLMNDQAGYHWFPNNGNPKGDLGLLDYTCPDYFIIQGPFLASHFHALWYKTLTRMRDQGTKIMFFAAGMMSYTKEDIEMGRKILKEISPFLMTTRDARTYEYFGDLVQHAYNGIDTALFVSNAIEPISLQLGKYLILNFDTIPEPRIDFVPQSGENTPSEKYCEFDGKTWHFKFPALRLKWSHQSAFYRYLDAQIPGGPFPVALGGYKVVRTDHAFNPPTFFRHTYKWPNSFCADIPHPYLHLYANTQITFSSRVHACVATIAYGRPAMLFARTPRSALFERIGLGDVTQRPVSVDLDYLNQEKAKMVAHLKSVIQADI